MPQWTKRSLAHDSRGALALLVVGTAGPEPLPLAAPVGAMRSCLRTVKAKRQRLTVVADQGLGADLQAQRAHREIADDALPPRLQLQHRTLQAVAPCL